MTWTCMGNMDNLLEGLCGRKPKKVAGCWHKVTCPRCLGLWNESGKPCTCRVCRPERCAVCREAIGLEEESIGLPDRSLVAHARCEKGLREIQAVRQLGSGLVIDPNVFSTVVADAIIEHGRQVKKWGLQDHDPFAYLAILTEEVGELAQAALQTRFGGPAGGVDKMRTEAIQVAAVALSIAETLDRGRWRWGAHRVEDAHEEVTILEGEELRVNLAPDGSIAGLEAGPPQGCDREGETCRGEAPR